MAEQNTFLVFALLLYTQIQKTNVI